MMKCWNCIRGGAESYGQVYSNLARTKVSLIRELIYMIGERDCNITASQPYSDISKWLHFQWNKKGRR